MATSVDTETPAQAHVRRYVEIMVEMRGRSLPTRYQYAGMEGVLQRHGRFWRPESRAPRRYLPTGQCFDNAYRTAKADPRLRYVEGIAMGMIPMHHAWCITPDDAVVDVTWRRTDVGAADGRRGAYFGVTVDLDRVRLVRLRGCAAVFGDYKGVDRLYAQPWEG